VHTITSALPYFNLIFFAAFVLKKAFKEFIPFDFAISQTFFDASIPK
tara:strand:- start:447 stop:587 length:141 start_codon:yes stop_codon:yes gene_type:complete